MPKLIFLLLFLLTSAALLFMGRNIFSGQSTGAPPYTIEDLNPPDNPLSWLDTWERPDGPPKVGLQVGHWKNEDFPEELARLRGNTGAQGGGKWEWEVNLAIAEKTASILQDQGVAVDILPATIPPQYWADAFVAIHSDGSEDPATKGFKAASPRRDYSGSASTLLTFVEEEYGQATRLAKDPNVTRNMRGYYAFAWWRYEHAVHPKNPSIILETGFLTNSSDRRIIVTNPQISANGLARGIIRYLDSKGLLTNDQK